MLAKTLQSAAGNAGEATYIEDVFSTYLYTGNGGTQTITNGIDLAGEGGMIWLKSRSSTTNPVYNHRIYDTARGVGAGTDYALSSNLTDAQANLSVISSVNSDGWTFGGSNPSAGNNNGDTYASWTFRKAKKFFDVVTYTGDGTAGRTVAHNLGSVPGCIIIKVATSPSIGSSDWVVYHRSTGNSKWLALNLTGAEAAGTFWNNTDPTDTHFTLGINQDVNKGDGTTYVAYLFAHDAGGFGEDGTENVISCGSYTGNGSTDGPEIDLGFEPQWVMIKSSTLSPSYWVMADNMRGMSETSDRWLYANLSNAEGVAGTYITSKANGFKINGTGSYANSSGQTYIYIAIRRGPMKVPESGTGVFAPITYTGNSSTQTVTTYFPVDLLIQQGRNTGIGNGLTDRLRGPGAGYLSSQSTSSENTSSGILATFDSNTGNVLQSSGFNQASYTFVDWSFRRAPGFFDVVAYTGTGVAHTEAHNLGVAPEMMIVKKRSGNGSWCVYHDGVAVDPETDYLFLESTAAASDSTSFWNDTAPTSTNFTVGTYTGVNLNGETFVAYLFASCPGVSKVGTYTGTGTTNQIDCGFSGGARFILIKRTNNTGDWYVWDSARGIVAGNDPYLLLNSSAAEVTSTDYVDTYSAGFEISSTAPAGINANGGTYIFLAIA